VRGTAGDAGRELWTPQEKSLVTWGTEPRNMGLEGPETGKYLEMGRRAGRNKRQVRDPEMGGGG
jgi:hypothetical protein